MASFVSPGRATPFAVVVSGFDAMGGTRLALFLHGFAGGVVALISAGQKAIAHSLFFIGLLALGLNYILYSVFGFDVARVPVRVFALALFSLSAVSNFKSLRFDILFLPMLGLAILGLLMHGVVGLNMLAVLLFVLAASPYPLSTVLSDLFKCFVVVTAVYLLAVMAGLAVNSMYVMEGRTRNTLGFVNVNAAALYFTPLLLLLTVKARQGILVVLGVVLAFAALFVLTDTRSILLVAGVFFVAYLLFIALGRVDTLSRLKGILGLLTLYLLVSLAFAMPLLAGSNLDHALSWRPSLFYEALAGFTPIDWLFGSSDFKEVDNSFIVIVGHYGVLFLACTIAVLHKSILRCAEADDPWGFSFLLAVLACGSIESFIYRPELIVTLAFWAVAFAYSNPVKTTLCDGDPKDV